MSNERFFGVFFYLQATIFVNLHANEFFDPQLNKSVIVVVVVILFHLIALNFSPWSLFFNTSIK